ncbi:MAG: cysteine--tRNA ligase [Nitrosomonas sp.]|nr:cysteine--tRNA ligase [Nitrosomonas sp.]MBK7363506.1 cysteine--tRNA ligase [Nitrosomonas sp.]
MLKIYNSLTRTKKTFTSLVPGEVKLYVCGMTVYDFCHLGHGRVLVVFDMVVRWLHSIGYNVIYVRNITDIDDKIIKRAQEMNESIETLTNRFINAMHEDADALGTLKPTFEPCATHHVEEMISLISKLIEKNCAYLADNGDVFFSVHHFPGYGKLSGKSLSDLRAGERVEIDHHKRDPLDFVLWKSVKPGEPYWQSPWGNGRPGWHIECSTMSGHFLGHHFDIHGGGQDLQFPHHENEIAQSEGANEGTYVNYWMHNGFVRVDNEKMSKSLGNFFTVREILKKFQAEVIRFFILRAHYRSPLNYSLEQLISAKNALDRLYTALKGYETVSVSEINWNNPHAQSFKMAMNDDFNTPEAIAILFNLASEINKSQKPQEASLLKSLANTLGLLQQEPQKYLRQSLATNKEQGFSESEINLLISQRLEAKKNRDFKQADQIRSSFAEAGIILEDTPQGTTWRRE